MVFWLTPYCPYIMMPGEVSTLPPLPSHLHNIKIIVLMATQGSMVKKCVVPSCGEYPYVVVPHCCVHLCRILPLSNLSILNFHVVSKCMVQDYYGEFSMCRILRESKSSNSIGNSFSQTNPVVCIVFCNKSWTKSQEKVIGIQDRKVISSKKPQNTFHDNYFLRSEINSAH